MRQRHIHTFLQSLMACIMLLASCPSMAQSLSGTVTIANSESSALATIRIVDLGIGTTSKLDGTYYLEDITPGRHTLEFNFIGHKTVTEKLTWAQGETKQLDVTMEEAPIMLTTAFITPNGEDPAQYILSRVWKKADQKRATMPSFDAKVTTVLSYSGFEIFMLYEFLPRLVRITIMGLAGVAGLKSFVKLLIAHHELNVSTKCDLHYQKKKFRWENFAIARCSTKLTDDEKKALYKLTKEDDLYDLVYGDENKLRAKGTQKALKGSYEDGNKMIYVIEGTKGDERYTMHIAEDTWDVLKLEKSDGTERLQVECRPAPGGLYLPVSINRKLTFVDMTAEEFRQHITMTQEGEVQPQADAGKDPKKTKKIKAKIEDNEAKAKELVTFFERCQQQGLRMVLNHGVSISWH